MPTVAGRAGFVRRNAPVLIPTFIGLALFAAFAVWAFHEGESLGGGWGSLRSVWPYVIGGVLAVAALAGGLMWLAFFSADRGYDDRMDTDKK